MTTRPIGVFRGVVVRVEGPHAWVHVPRLNATVDHAYGPLEVLQFPGSPGLETANGSGHTHALSVSGSLLAPGNRVLVAPVDGRPDDLIVLGRIAT